MPDDPKPKYVSDTKRLMMENKDKKYTIYQGGRPSQYGKQALMIEQVKRAVLAGKKCLIISRDKQMSIELTKEGIVKHELPQVQKKHLP